MPTYLKLTVIQSSGSGYRLFSELARGTHTHLYNTWSFPNFFIHGHRSRSRSRVPRRPPARLDDASPARLRLTPSCGLPRARCGTLSASFDDNVAAHARMRAESFTADLSAPAMLTLLPWFLLRSTRAYRYTMTCRARAGLPRARGLRTTLILQMLEQLELPTHWLHPAAHHIRHAPQTRAQFHGQFS